MRRAVLLTGAFAVIAAWSGASSRAAAQERLQEFDFAAGAIGEWELKASTTVGWSQGQDGRWQPSVSAVECRGEAPHAGFSIDGAGNLGALRLNFLGPADADGDRNDITLLGDRLWLFIDGERWEFAHIPARRLFANIHYPMRDGAILPVWTGHRAVRAAEGLPWINFSRLYERLLAADTVEWGFKSRDWTAVDGAIPENRLPEGWETVRYVVDLGGLRDATAWCAEQVGSDAAYVFPGAIEQGIGEDAGSRERDSRLTTAGANGRFLGNERRED